MNSSCFPRTVQLFCNTDTNVSWSQHRWWVFSEGSFPYISMETSAFITADMDNFYIALAETSAFLNSQCLFFVMYLDFLIMFLVLIFHMNFIIEINITDFSETTCCPLFVCSRSKTNYASKELDTLDTLDRWCCCTDCVGRSSLCCVEISWANQRSVWA